MNSVAAAWRLAGLADTGRGAKVIIYKSRGEVSLLEQPTIECVFYPI